MNYLGRKFHSASNYLLGCFICLMSSVVVAQAAPAAIEGETAIAETIKTSLLASRPGLSVESIKASPIAGLYAVQIANGPVLYSTADGKYFVLGDLYQVAVGGFVNLAEQERESGRAELMAGVNMADMIVFSPKQQPAKASIMVFTDVDCFYCQKLHQEVPDLNRLGIEVRYLAYPRAGIGSDSYKKIASAWCAKDKQEALTKLKNRQPITTNVCATNPVAAQFSLGQQVGVTGTPALITEQGRLMPGYMPALQLASALGVPVDPEIAAELQAKQAAQKQR
ncbi:DsbC family protein [Oceanicoccus sp. KOV_DT_Chl]|uniref:DsbC family protein n=1 Tax=Oceanicoccus sp. KOV_DT_Chl TaxID=1904639 RepID=UPI001F3D5F46|nr:DsbC family protein [Oceanicoccus sp. KOV_DT_Chl]